jgi:hypothetical protein
LNPVSLKRKILAADVESLGFSPKNHDSLMKDLEKIDFKSINLK